MIFKNVELHNVQEIVTEEGTQDAVFCRIPNALRPLIFPRAAQQALSSAGCEIRFNLMDDQATVIIKAVSDDDKTKKYMAQVFFGGFQSNSVLIGCEPTEINLKLPGEIECLKNISREYGVPFDPCLVRIILPYSARISLVDIVGEVTPPNASQTPSKKWLAYGSSITHGSAAVHPSGTYAMRTARSLGVDLINMGFAGSAMLDKAMADYISDRSDWDFATLEMGVNLIWDSDKNAFRPVEEFQVLVDYFVPKIVHAHPEKPIFCIDQFTVNGDFQDDTVLKEYRRVVREKVAEMNMPNLYYINGRDLLHSVTGLTVDLIHPSDEGMYELSVNLSNFIRKTLYQS